MYQDGSASLPLQISLYFHGFYSAALAVVTLLMFIYKSALLPYPPSILGFEVTYVFLFMIVEWVRIRQGARRQRRRRRRARGRGARGQTKAAAGATRVSPLPHTAHTPSAASKGNRLESIANVAFSLLLAAPVIVFHIYFVALQTYVLRLDVIIQAIALAFVVFEVLFSGVALLNFTKAQTV
jgi:transmembrane protein 216